MQLKFICDEEKNMDVFMIDENGHEKEFDYLTFVKSLYVNNEFNDTIFYGPFTDDEKESVREMLNKISNNVISRGMQ